MKKLVSHRIFETQQVEIMRTIYNENLDMLATTAIPFRTYEEQQTWWNENKNGLKAFLYEKVDEPGSVIAFSVLTDRGGFYTPIIAITKNEWGKGYGLEIIFDYIEKADGPLAGSQLKSNLAICHMNKKVGWEIIDEIGQDDKVVQLLYHPGAKAEELNEPGIRDKIINYLRLKYKE
jgi:hypothetical protein